jgi:hypothetical protein
MRNGWIMFVSVALAGCQTAANPDPVSVAGPYTPTTLTSTQVSAVKNSVSAKLREPGTAKFGEIAGALDAAGNLHVCGMVNAKNGFGGFTGMSPFGVEFGSSAPKVNGPVSSDPELAGMLVQICRKQGIAL